MEDDGGQEQVAAALADAGAKPAKPADAFGDPDRRRGMVMSS